MKENEKLSTYKRIKRVFKKKSDEEVEKRNEKKAIKRNKPKGMTAKRIGMITFWLLFSFMFFVVAINFVGGSSSGIENDRIESRNDLFTSEGVEFTKDFVKDYFTWSTDKHAKDIREYKLEPYFISSFDKLDELVFDRDWSSVAKKEDITLKDIHFINEQEARYTFHVKFRMEKPTDKKDTKIDYDKLSFEEILERENEVIVKNGKKIKQAEKYIDIPVYLSEKNEFAVSDVPAFTYFEIEQVEDERENVLDALETVKDSFVEDNVVAFLETFYESYTKDSKDKLNYILEDEKHVYGLNETMEFQEIKSVEVYEVDENHNSFVAETYVTLVEPDTDLEFINKHVMVIERKDNRFIVTSLNDEKYLTEYIEGYLSEDEEEREEQSNSTEENDIDNNKIDNEANNN